VAKSAAARAYRLWVLALALVQKIFLPTPRLRLPDEWIVRRGRVKAGVQTRLMAH
jgi:hypothetical protein